MASEAEKIAIQMAAKKMQDNRKVFEKLVQRCIDLHIRPGDDGWDRLVKAFANETGIDSKEIAKMLKMKLK